MSVLQSLKWIFWGIVLAAVAIWVNGFDLLNDVLGYAIIAVGVIGLVRNSVAVRYGFLLKLIAIVAVLNALWAPFAECPGRMPFVEKTVGVAFGVLNVFATIGFCVVMRRLCEKISLGSAEKSWRTSLFYWRFGLPISLAAACLSWWTAKDEHGMITADTTPLVVLIPYLVLSFILIAVLAHSFVSLGRTIAGLKGMVMRLPAASDFGLDQRPAFHFQFSIRALMIVTAATAVIAAGASRGTILCWQMAMAGLVGLGLAAMWLDHRMLAKGLLVVVAFVLFAGHSQIGRQAASGGIGGFVARTGDSSAKRSSSRPIVAEIEAWLADRGFQKSNPPADNIVLGLSAGVRCNRAATVIWYAGRAPKSQQLYVKVHYFPLAESLLQFQVDYLWSLSDFPWVVRKHERQVAQFTGIMADWLREYDERLQKSCSNP